MSQPTDEELDQALELSPALLARLTWDDAGSPPVSPPPSVGTDGAGQASQTLWCLPRASRGADGRLCAWWPREPAPSGGPVPWLPASELPLRGARSTKSHVLCIHGPLHRVKLLRSVKTGERSLAVHWPLLSGQAFSVKPYQGHYYYSSGDDRYVWSNG